MLRIVIWAFIALEVTNVAALYFAPETRYANAVGVFRAYGRSKADEPTHDLVRYLTNWVAGTKLIFLVLLVVILTYGSDDLLVPTGLALIATIGTFYWRLFPLARKMDRDGQLEPDGYSKALGAMIAAMLSLLLIATTLELG